MPIPGTKRRKYLEDNAGAARIEPIEETAPKDAAAGDRYAGMGTINL